MFELRRAPARPRKAVIIARHHARIRRRPQRHQVELVLVRHMRLQPLRTLTGVAGGPSAAVDLLKDGFRRRLHRELALHHLVGFEHFLAEAQLLGQAVDHRIVVVALEDRLDHFLAPLDRTVGGRTAAVAFELRRDRQKIGVIRPVMERRERRGMRVGHHQKVERVHALERVAHPRDRVAAVAEHDHRLDVVALIDLLDVERGRVEPPG